MTSDPLYDPVGLTVAPERPRRRNGGRWLAAALLLLTGGGSAALLVAKMHRAEPRIAIVSIDPAPKPAPPPPVAAAAPPAVATPGIHDLAVDETRGDTVEVQNGVKIIRLGQATSSKSIAIPVPDATLTPLKAAPDPRLLEASRFGDLPRIGAGGLRPSVAYARPVSFAGQDLTGVPRIALLVAGMGVDQMATAEAARRLPPAVSFAFPPGSADLAAQTAETRRAGHEIVLQLATEADPLGFVAGAAESETLDHLHGMMGRFAAYPGVAIIGGPGTLSDPVIAAPVLRDIAARGLYLVDDARLGRGTPDGANLQSASPDLVIDAGQGTAALGEQFNRLVSAARQNGTALGVVRAGGRLDALAAFVGTLEAKGLALVPVSALATRPRVPAQAAK